MNTRDPCFALTYGVSKAGKSTDNLYSFPGAFYLAPPGALNPSSLVVGFEVPHQHCYDPRSVADATAVLRELGKNRGQRCKHCGEPFLVVCVDDFSLLAEISLVLYENRKGGPWVPLMDDVLEFRDTARRVGLHVVVNCHEKSPDIKNGVARRGGPRLPGNLPEGVPAGCDMVLRATAAGGGFSAQRRGWGGIYQCNPTNLAWVTGDRYGVTPDGAPMNLAELLRAAGFEIPRLRALAWMDNAVAIVASELMNHQPNEADAVLANGAQWLLDQLSQAPEYANDPDPERLRMKLHARWVLRDAYDRVTLTRARSNPLSLFGLTMGPMAAAPAPVAPEGLNPR